MKKPGNKPVNITKENDLKSYLIIALVAFAAYANTLLNDFVYDDEPLVTSDSSITNISNIPKFFTGQEGYNQVFVWFYSPIVSSSFSIDYAVWKFNPAGFHLTNILLNLINCLLLYKFLKIVFRHEKKTKKSSVLPHVLLIGTLLFAVHPVHTEAVSWISGRTDMLAFTFYIASFMSYLQSAEEVNSFNRSIKVLLTGLFYFLSLFAKEVSITLPAAIILYDLIVKRHSFKTILKEKTGVYTILLLVSILYLVIRWIVLKDLPSSERSYYFYGKDFSTAFLTMSQTIPLYLRLMIFPVGLLYQYNNHLPYTGSFFGPSVVIAFVLVIILSVLTVYFYKKNSLISYSIIFFFLTLLPIMNIFPTSNLAAERFLYIPSISLILILVYIGFKFEPGKYQNSFFTASLAIILIFTVLTVSRNADWKNNDKLYLSAEDKPGLVVFVNIGNLYTQRKQYDKAEMYYRRAIQLKDDDPIANNNFGRVFMLEGRYDSSYYYITKAYKYDTLNPEPRFTLAIMYALSDRTADAVNEIEKLQKITPNYKNSGQLLVQLKSQLQKNSEYQFQEDHK